MGSRSEHGSCPCALGRRKYKLGCEEGRGRKLLSRAETPPGRTAWLSKHFHPPPFTGPPGLEGLSTVPPAVGPTGQTPVRPGDAAPVWEPRGGAHGTHPHGTPTLPECWQDPSLSAGPSAHQTGPRPPILEPRRRIRGMAFLSPRECPGSPLSTQHLRVSRELLSLGSLHFRKGG